MKKLLAVFLTICLMFGLTACGSKSSSDNKSAGATDSNSGKATGSADATGATGASSTYNGEAATITVFTEWVGTHPYAGYFKDRLESFKKAYPNIKVNVEEIAGSSTANMDAKLKVLVSSGELPDVFYTNDQSIIDLAKKAGLLYDFKSKVDADKEFNDDLNMSDIEAWNGGSDHIYGICSHKDFFGFFYNKKLLKDAGYDAFPTTWDDFYKMCDALKANGVAPMALETKTAWYPSLTLLSLLASENDAGKTMANTVNVKNYNTPEFIDAASKLQKMFKNYTTQDAVGSDITVALNYFESGKTAMVFDGAWRINELKASSVGKDVDVAMLPGNGAVSYPGYAWFSGSKDEKTAAASYEFIKWFNNLEDQTTRLGTLGLIPASPNVDYTSMDLPDQLVKLLEMKDKTDYTILSCWRVYNAGVTSIIPQELAALGTGQSTPKEFADHLTKASQ